MTFLNPTYLWALLGLAVPLAIHLWSRKKVRVIKVGSTQFFESLDPKQTNSVEWNELVLLAMRVLAISLLVTILAQPRWERNLENIPITYLVEPSLLRNDGITRLIDSLPSGAIRLLQPEFPALNSNATDGISDETPNYWQLAKEMEELPSDSIVVFTKALQKGLLGARPAIAANIKWVLVNEEKVATGPIKAAIHNENISLLRASGSTQRLSFEKESIPRESDRLAINAANDSVLINQGANEIRLALIKDAPIKVYIAFNADLTGQMKYLASAFRAIGSHLDKKIDVQTESVSDIKLPIKGEILVWLSEKPIPAYPNSILVFRQDSLAKSLIIPGPKKNAYHLTRLLTVENVVSEDLTSQLLPLLNLHPDLLEKAGPYDRRAVALNELRPVESIRPKGRNLAQWLDISPWLWAFLAVLLIAERLVSKYRRQ